MRVRSDESKQVLALNVGQAIVFDHTGISHGPGSKDNCPFKSKFRGLANRHGMKIRCLHDGHDFWVLRVK